MRGGSLIRFDGVWSSGRSPWSSAATAASSSGRESPVLVEVAAVSCTSTGTPTSGTRATVTTVRAWPGRISPRLSVFIGRRLRTSTPCPPTSDPSGVAHIGHRDDDQHVDEARRALGCVVPAADCPGAGCRLRCRRDPTCRGRGYWLQVDVASSIPPSCPLSIARIRAASMPRSSPGSSSNAPVRSRRLRHRLRPTTWTPTALAIAVVAGHRRGRSGRARDRGPDAVTSAGRRHHRIVGIAVRGHGMPSEPCCIGGCRERGEMTTRCHA